MVSLNEDYLVANLSVLCLFKGEADIEAYENDDFDEEEATELKKQSQLKQDRQILIASGTNQNGNDVLDLGDDFDDEDDDEENQDAVDDNGD